jgi:hypothetical protein
MGFCVRDCPGMLNVCSLSGGFNLTLSITMRSG